MSKKLLIGVVVVVVVVAVGIGIWRSMSPSLSLTRTFVSEVYGVAINYPPSWTARHRLNHRDEPSAVVVHHPVYLAEVSVLIRDLDSQVERGVVTPEDEVNWYLATHTAASDRTLVTKPTATRVRGYPAYSVTWSKPSTGNWTRYTAIRKGNLMYIVVAHCSDALYLAETEAVLKSFRFTG